LYDKWPLDTLTACFIAHNEPIQPTTDEDVSVQSDPLPAISSFVTPQPFFFGLTLEDGNGRGDVGDRQ
jgi:hypothetical protein